MVLVLAVGVVVGAIVAMAMGASVGRRVMLGDGLRDGFVVGTALSFLSAAIPVPI